MSADELERLRAIVAHVHKPPRPGKVRRSLGKIKRTLLKIAKPTKRRPKTGKTDKRVA